MHSSRIFFCCDTENEKGRIRHMIQVKMFFDSDFDKLEETAQTWIRGSEGIAEVIWTREHGVKLPKS